MKHDLKIGSKYKVLPPAVGATPFELGSVVTLTRSDFSVYDESWVYEFRDEAEARLQWWVSELDEYRDWRGYLLEL